MTFWDDLVFSLLWLGLLVTVVFLFAITLGIV